MITAAEKLETQSVTTDGSGGDMFVTKTKVEDRPKPSQQTALAIHALAVINKGKPIEEEEKDAGPVAVWGLENLAMEEQTKLE